MGWAKPSHAYMGEINCSMTALLGEFVLTI